MPKRRRQTGMSVKSARILAQWGVEEALAGGANVVAVGPVYRLRDGARARLAFTREDEHGLCVGYAVEQEKRWAMVESDPYSARSLGYYQRRLKRVGTYDPTGGQ
jgi:hypothetical protein